MKKVVSKEEYFQIEKNLNELLALADERGGFDFLNNEELKKLNSLTEIIKTYEGGNYSIPLPQTLQGLIELKMYEKKLKQKELAKLLNTSDTKLSEIMHNKRKPSLSFLKAMHQILEIDGNLLLKIC